MSRCDQSAGRSGICGSPPSFLKSLGHELIGDTFYFGLWKHTALIDLVNLVRMLAGETALPEIRAVTIVRDE